VFSRSGSHKRFRTPEEKEAMLHYNGLAAEAAQQALGGGPLRGLTKQSPLPGGIRAVLLARVISDCHFPVHLNRFIPDLLSYPVAVFLK
jgi:hypothetical protein